MIALLTAFHHKLILPTLCLAVAIGVAGYFMPFSTPIVEGIGFGYFVAGPLVHYFIYEVKNENEYYFYFNKGITKIILYGTTLILNLILGSLILLVWLNYT
jgi:hypothetical protein